MKGIFGCLRLQASRAMATQAMDTNSTAEEAHGMSLENKISTDNTTNTSDEPQPRVSPVEETDSHGDPVQNNAQAGVQKIEATTQVWSKKHLVAAYVM
jgi:hypothetical protein